MDGKLCALLWSRLKGVTEEELDWKIHPEANTIRWILGHLIWFEEWIPDAATGTGRYLTEKKPLSYEVGNLGAIRSRFDEARGHYQTMLAKLSEEEMAKELDYFGVYTATLQDVVRTHTSHLAGHTYQIRFIRGVHSRAHKTRKADFDPF
jgi:hypothetical protein